MYEFLPCTYMGQAKALQESAKEAWVEEHKKTAEEAEGPKRARITGSQLLKSP
jgi:hypothetical protein